MKRLTPEAHARAVAFLNSAGRPLEQALLQHHRGLTDAAPALKELGEYQRPDGGFGGGLEPDLQLTTASVLATTVALQHLAALDAPDDDLRVSGALAFLTRTWEPRLKSWPLVPPNTDDAPHAPWWSVGDDFAEKWRGFQGNPKPEIAGYLLRWPELAPAGLRGLAEDTVAWLEAWTEEVEMHDLLCFVRLLDTPQLPDDLRSRLHARLTAAVRAQLAHTPEAWAQYGLQPLDLAPSPKAPLAAEVASSIEANLDWMIDQQGEDGAWSPPWSWFGLYDEAWPAAEAAWKSVLTLRNLQRLEAWRRA